MNKKELPLYVSDDYSNTCNRHAYMIIAHNEFELLKLLIRLLDYENNDIYIHIDKKSAFKNFDSLYSVVSRANLSIFSEQSVNWGGL